MVGKSRSERLPCSARVIAAVAVVISGDWLTYRQLKTEVSDTVGHNVTVSQLRRSIRYLKGRGVDVHRDEAFRRRSGADQLALLRRIACELQEVAANG